MINDSVIYILVQNDVQLLYITCLTRNVRQTPELNGDEPKKYT
jgi:hypothetical protein